MLPIRFLKPATRMFNWDAFGDFDGLTRLAGLADHGCCDVAADVSEEADRYVVKADLPGFKTGDVQVTFEGGVLSISGEVANEIDEQKDQFHIRERSWGKVSRSFTFPEDVDSDGIEAGMSDGVLTVTLQKSPTATPRKIEVKAD